MKAKPSPPAPFSLEEAPFIPMPAEIVTDSGSFALSSSTGMSNIGLDKELFFITDYLTREINAKTSINFPAIRKNTSLLSNSIHIKLNKDTLNNALEAYQLHITPDTLTLTAGSPEGIFRGVQTLLQLIPEAKDSIQRDSIKTILLPLGTIKDAPVFAWRGAMLDVARHFFTVVEVKQYIRLLAAYKINKLHLHLTDDQGWRIAIDTFPKLSEIGGKTEVGGGEGGYYTKADYQEIVAFATKHFITIIPEVDMPGHTNAASVAYPFLNGNAKKVKPYTGMKVGFSTFDTRKDTVYDFIETVIKEISAITPGSYFHIGGDESHVTKEKDYRYFVRKVEQLVKKHGKQMIGWDEVASVAVDSSTIAQFWNNEVNAKKAVEKGMKVILSPGKKAYLDMKYDKNSQYGLTWAGYIPIDTAYIWQPETYAGIPLENILGIEAPLWSETISNLKELEYLAFPRILGYAELGWTRPELRNWENYRERLARQARFLKRKKVNFYSSPLIDWNY
ncbi:family 20 glycosylhydrolase [Ascidiimonas sp. W6]|uniref:family 20 glycosylhydrolase n=1 Tax=Ascidiimonas meishanensis TaxID=3128903 RepID=UPI0030EC07BF